LVLRPGVIHVSVLVTKRLALFDLIGETDYGKNEKVPLGQLDDRVYTKEDSSGYW